MKIVLLVLFLVCSVSTPGQEASDWIFLTADEGGIQIAVPKRSLVHQQPNQSSFFVLDFRNAITLSREAVNDAQQVLKRMEFNAKVEKLKFGDYLVKYYVDTTDKRYSLTLYAASQNALYYVSATSPTQTGEQIGNVLGSLLIGGQRVFPNYLATQKPTGVGEEFESIPTSQPIKDALLVPRPSPTSAIFQDIKKADLTPTDPPLTKSLLILEKPRADFAGYANHTRMMGSKPRGGEVRAKVEFLANGRIGKIVIDPALDRMVLEKVAEAICAIKFIPAESAGSPVTVSRVITYSFHVSN